MTNKELKQKAIALSGRPPRKNKLGIGAYRWLADQLNVHPSTMARWIRGRGDGSTRSTGSDIPEWVDEEIERMEQEIVGEARETESVL